MSDLVKCEACKGKKRILGMGGIYKDCKTCSGIGWVEKSITADELIEAHEKLDKAFENLEPKELDEKTVTRKKYGRKK